MKPVHFSRLSTEQENPRSTQLDQLGPRGVVRLMNREDQQVLRAIRGAEREIARAVEQIVAAFRNGGRLFFIGAGTSGRLGIIEAAECPPTFGTSSSMVQGIMAGGRSAVFKSKEGSEDSESAGRGEVRRRVGRHDVLVGIAASGVTPFVRAGLGAAKRKGAKTILVTCHLDPSNRRAADVVVGLKTGPEVLTGSTRLKAGSACKMTLNMLTTASMVQMGKTFGHWMVDLQPKSRKLVARGQRLIERLGRVSPADAQRLYAESQGRVKRAIVMARLRVTRQEADSRLQRANGHLRRLFHEA